MQANDERICIEYHISYLSSWASGFRFYVSFTDFNFFSKQERGELVVVDKIASEDVIICNNVSFLEYIFLEKVYGPVFT